MEINNLVIDALSFDRKKRRAGSGDIRVRIGPAVGGDVRFNGAIDNLEISSSAVAIPVPPTIALLAVGLLAGAGFARKRRAG